MTRKFDDYSLLGESHGKFSNKNDHNYKYNKTSVTHHTTVKQPSFGYNQSKNHNTISNSNIRPSVNYYRNKSQPPVACYPVTMSVDDNDAYTNKAIHTNNKTISKVPSKNKTTKPNFFNKKYTTPVKYDNFNYSRPYSNSKLTQTNTQVEKSKITSYNEKSIKTEQCQFNESDFPTIEDTKISNLTLDNNQSHKVDEVCDESQNIPTKNNDNIFPFPPSIREIYIHMYNQYKNYEKCMLETIASQNQINISTNENQNVFSDEDIKKYLYMLFTQSFATFINCMNNDKDFNPEILSGTGINDCKELNEITHTDQMLDKNETFAANSIIDESKSVSLKSSSVSSYSNNSHTNENNINQNVELSQIATTTTTGSNKKPHASNLIYKPPHMRTDPSLDTILKPEVTNFQLDTSNSSKVSSSKRIFSRMNNEIPTRKVNSMVISSTGVGRITVTNSHSTLRHTKRS